MPESRNTTYNPVVRVGRFVFWKKSTRVEVIYYYGFAFCNAVLSPSARLSSLHADPEASSPAGYHHRGTLTEAVV